VKVKNNQCIECGIIVRNGYSEKEHKCDMCSEIYKDLEDARRKIEVCIKLLKKRKEEVKQFKKHSIVMFPGEKQA